MSRVVNHWTEYANLLNTAFSQVCDPTDWKNPIDCLVPWEAANVYMEAIAHHTATTATCVRVVRDGLAFAHLQAPGYYAGPAC